MGLAEYALFAFESLFVIVDPIATVPAFLVMTARVSIKERFALVGQSPFKILGITLPAFRSPRR
jgi:multiple antibiotic resistance protein